MLAYVLGVRPAADAPALTFGSYIHASLERVWGSKPLTPVEVPKGLDPFKVETAAAMIEGYFARWEYPTTAIGAELPFRAPLVNPETGSSSRTFELGGKLDALMLDENGNVLIVEHKTAGEDIGPGTPYWQRLRIDCQISTYYVGARALGHAPVGVLYDVLRKPTIRPRVADTPGLWGARLRGDIAEHPDKYYQRGVVVLLEDEERDAAFDTWQTARAIAEADRLNRHPRNADACVRWGRLCSFFQVCTGASNIEDSKLFRRASKRNEELAESTPTGDVAQ